MLLSIAAGTAFGLTATASPAVAETTGNRYFLDCQAGNDTGAGTNAQPWKSLQKVNTVNFAAGDTLSIRAGTTCAGVLTPRGSGTKAAPIVVNSYGSGSAPKIVAAGARAAVMLRNQQGWEFRGLDITTTGAAGTPRAGIYVEATDFGTAAHFVVSGVVVHDINGCDCTGFDELSGGILFNAKGTARPTGFDDIQVTGNVVSHVDGIGIGTASHWARRDLYPDGPGSTWVPHTNVQINRNSLTDLGGDGIVVQNGSGAVIQQNSVNGYSKRATAYHSGVWAWDSDNTLIQYNEIANGGGDIPTKAMDVDGANNGIVYQYNSSHDNKGGLLLACAIPGMRTINSSIKYNSSKNDLDVGSGVITLACDPQAGMEFTNNVIESTTSPALIKNSSTTSAKFTGNKFTGQAMGSTIDDKYGVYSGNVFTNVTNPPPQG
ncbi:right-handed parallel beta-helix repeat-containing protein [Amycolatopsis sp. NPDC059021]|uniref:right-handed parallel beta-helix repeat-containing protein n=1 Tax=Amycolatopsis sp. NPDC059021 TaxID=3346704 RepID=UPI00366BDC70